MKYKLINSVSKKETICDKVVVDGWDYYVSDEIIEEGWKGTAYKKDVKGQIFKHFHTTNEWYKDAKKVIATNNPSINLPKVVDEVDKMSWNMADKMTKLEGHYERIAAAWGFKNGYNKSQETHPNSDEDMVNFLKFYKSYNQMIKDEKWNSIEVSEDRFLQLWKEQQPKTLYYVD